MGAGNELAVTGDKIASVQLRAIAEDPGIDEVILSGGDPWSLSTAKLAEPFPLDTPESVPDPLAADPTTSVTAAPDLSSPSATPPPDQQE